MAAHPHTHTYGVGNDSLYYETAGSQRYIESKGTYFMAPQASKRYCNLNLYTNVLPAGRLTIL